MNIASQRIQIAIGIVLIAILCAVAWFVFEFFFSVFLKSNPSVQASIIAAVAAITSLTVTAWRERSRSIREAHREKKIEVYTEFYDIIFELMGNVRNKKAAIEVTEDSEIVKNLMRVSRGALFYGSPKVILALAGLRSLGGREPDGLAPLRHVGRILLAMRADIGLSNRGLDEINIHQLYVKDDLKTVEIA